MSAQYNDGSVPYGSRVEAVSRPATLPGGSNPRGTFSNVSYVFENITVNRPTFIIKRYDEARNPSASVGIDDFVEGSAVVQLATSSTKELAAGDTFSDTFDQGLGAENFIIHSVDQTLTQGDYRKQPIRFIKKLN